MFLSNAATAMMMLPIGLAVISQVFALHKGAWVILLKLLPPEIDEIPVGREFIRNQLGADHPSEESRAHGLSRLDSSPFRHYEVPTGS